MKKYIIIVLGVVIVFILGLLTQYFFISGFFKSKEPSGSEEVAYWVAPMDPTYRRDKPGKSPMGMDLVPVYVKDANSEDNSSDVKISPVVEQNLGVMVAKVSRKTLSKQIDTVGYVTVDENKIDHVHTYTDGWVRLLLVKTIGEHVKKGQLLFELYSPKIVNAQEEYLLALKNENKSLIDASHKKLLTLGVSEIQIKNLKKSKKASILTKVFSNKSGIVSELNIREGEYVKPEHELIVLEDLSQIWINGEIFEKQSQWVKEGQEAYAMLPYLPGKKWQGKVDYVYPRLDPVTHTLKIRLSFQNPKEELKPNMYANIVIFASAEKDVLTIPREAVIDTGEGARVVLSLGDGRYSVKNIKLGFESGDYVAVLSGLHEGDNVVTSAQFLIDSESNLKASINRVTGHQH